MGNQGCPAPTNGRDFYRQQGRSVPPASAAIWRRRVCLSFLLTSEVHGSPGVLRSGLVMEIRITFQLRLDGVACVALIKAVLTTAITMALLSGQLTAVEIERLVHLLAR